MKQAYGVFVTAVVILVIGLAAFATLRSGPTSTSSSTRTTQNSTSYPGETVFSSQEVELACPDLPTANQLLSEERTIPVGIIPGNVDVGLMMNYSSTVFGYLTGQVYPNFVHIALFNGTVWVIPPETFLQTIGCVAALTNST